MDAFDADVLIYAAAADHSFSPRLRALFVDQPPVGVGSVLLLTELLIKPTRHERHAEIVALGGLLARLELRPTDRATAGLAISLGASYGLRPADAVHLATAVNAGADRFITNNRRDLPRSITEIEITYPEDLPEPDDTMGA